MLAGLVETVEKLQERIRAHRPLIGSFEIRTRASLIDPILRALDWEVGDPTQVTLEKAIAEAGRPDYALLDLMGKTVLFIEAKKLDDTHEPMEQVVRYVVGENTKRRDYKVPFCACTNGDVWKVFDVLNQDLVLETSISRDRASDCAFKLLSLWRTSLIDGSLRTPVKLSSGKLIESADQVHDLGELEPADDDAWTLANLKVEDGIPKSITFPDEDAKELRTRKELLVSVAEYLVRTGDLTARNAINSSGSKRYIVHSSLRHPSGNPFVQPVRLSNGLHLETSNSFSQTISFARKLLELYGRDARLAERVRLGR